MEVKLSSLLKRFDKKNKQTFLTGTAGTGKTFSINMIKGKVRNPILLSTTHMSAQLIGADTLHSFFNLGTCKSIDELVAYDSQYFTWFRNNVTNSKEAAIKSRYKNMRLAISNSSLIIIDEVSMLSAEVLDLIYYRLNQIQDIFGLKIPHILFVGDLFQLAPVSNEEEGKVLGYNTKQSMVFCSENWKPLVIELTKIFRTKDEEFAKALSHIRLGKYTRLVNDVMHGIIDNMNESESTLTTLAPTNKQVDKINKSRLSDLPGESFVFKAKVESSLKPKETETIVKNFPADETLVLKVGAEVMFLVNDKEHGIYNGKKGLVESIDDDTINVSVVNEDGEVDVIGVSQETFTKCKIGVDEDGEISYKLVVTMSQFPLKLAYATTFHKAQGMSIDGLLIDCKNIFSPAMFYVALSRAVNTHNLFVKNFDRKYVRFVNPDVLTYMDSLADELVKTPCIIDDLKFVEV